MNQILRLAVTAGVLSCVTSAHAQLIDPLVPNELMVRVESDRALDACVAALSAEFPGVGVLDSIPGRHTHLISYSLGAGQTAAHVELLLGQLADAETIIWGELNYEGQAAEGKTDSLWVSQLGIGSREYGGQYSIDLLGLTDAHQKSTGLGVIVAVLDTGVDAAHPALAGAVLGNGANFVNAFAATTDVGDGIDNDGDGLIDEMVGHGTFVAGLVRLVAPDAKLVPVTVLDSEGVGDAFQIAKGMYWAIDSGAEVINMSLGSTYHSASIEDAAVEAMSKGVVVVGAAGNWNVEKPREFPACDSSAFGVAALDRLDKKAPFSNYNDKLNFSAPGHSELMTGSATLFDPAKSIISAVPGGGYGVWRGTSFATAFVSGAAALIRAQHPGWPNEQVPAMSIVPTIELTLATTAVDIYDINPAYEDLLGAGRIDAAAATAVGPTQPTLGDLSGNGSVDAADVAILLGAWGACTGGCPADLSLDGVVNAADLAIMLGNWG